MALYRFSDYVEAYLKKDGIKLTLPEKYQLDALDKISEWLELNDKIKYVNKLYLDYKGWLSLDHDR